MTKVGVFVRGLDPSPDEARAWFAGELAGPEYHDSRSLLQRLMEWLGRRISDLQDTAGTGAISLPPVVVTVLLVLLAVGAALLLTRVRTERRTRPERRTVLGDTTLDASRLRAAGAAAIAGERYDEAVLGYVRAIAREAEQRTLLTNAPSLTAHEVGEQLAAAFPQWDSRVRAAMVLFDEVAYGAGTATRDDAYAVRDTDERLRVTTPARVAGSPSAGPQGPGELVTEAPVAVGVPAGRDEAGASPDSVWLRQDGAR